MKVLVEQTHPNDRIKHSSINERSIRSCYHDGFEDEWLLVQVPVRQDDGLCSILESLSIGFEKVKGCNPWIQFEAPSVVVQALIKQFPGHAFDVL